MERNYNRQELELKKIPELKDLLRIRSLKVTGNKDDLIKRILDNQISSPSSQSSLQSFPIPSTSTNQNNYLDILPKDIKGVLENYQAGHQTNNKIVNEILSEFAFGKFYSNKEFRDKFNDKLKELGIGAEMILNPDPEAGKRLKGGMRIPQTIPRWYNPKIITDQVLIDFFDYIYKQQLMFSYEINEILYENKSNIIVFELTIQIKMQDNKYMFDRVFRIGYFEPIKTSIKREK